MFSQKQPRITNIWSKIIQGDEAYFSTVVVESAGACRYSASRQGNDIVLKGAGVVANMPIGSIEVNDGLVREITLLESGSNGVTVTIRLEHPAGYRIESSEGIPAKIIIFLERSTIAGLLKGKRILIDPGHGGNDAGGKGPVNLLEKNVVLLIAGELEQLLGQAGAVALLTREGDESIPFRGRLKMATDEQADLFIGIHTHADDNCKVGGTAVLYKTACRASLEMAKLVKEELIKKLKLADRGLKGSRKYAALEGVPVVEAEVVAITNWVEEGLLRSPTFHKRAAEGIFNGVIKYYAKTAGNKKVKV